MTVLFTSATASTTASRCSQAEDGIRDRLVTGVQTCALPITPDIERQTDYYTEVLGLSLIAEERGAVFLSSTLDHHSVVLRKGPDAKCLRIGFQLAPEDDLDE